MNPLKTAKWANWSATHLNAGMRRFPPLWPPSRISIPPWSTETRPMLRSEYWIGRILDSDRFGQLPGTPFRGLPLPHFMCNLDIMLYGGGLSPKIFLRYVYLKTAVLSLFKPNFRFRQLP